MPAQDCSRFLGCLRRAVALTLTLAVVAFAPTARAQPITHLNQLKQALSSTRQTIRDVDLNVTVCAASRPKVGVLIVQDKTGFELLQISDFGREIQPGEQIRIRRSPCLLRKREMGVELSAVPLVNNDGMHSRTAKAEEVVLKAGRIPLRLEWFNNLGVFSLDVSWSVSNEPPQSIKPSNLCHRVVAEPGATNFLPGLRAEYYEGLWENLPDFNLFRPVTTRQVTNFDLRVRSRDEGIGIQYSGYLDVPRDGQYRFVVRSDDGAALFLGDSGMAVVSLGRAQTPEASHSKLLSRGTTNLDEPWWTVVEGTVSFVSRDREGVRLDLTSDQRVISVRLADADGLDLSNLPNARVRITGIGRFVTTLDQTQVLGKLFAASAKDLIFIDHPFKSGDRALPLTSVAQVQNLPIERARKGLPVRIRGIVTGATKASIEHWMSFQDDTRGAFVRLDTFSNPVPAFGEMWEIEGRSGAGNFAPIIIADKITRLGEGLMPAPVNPTWTELLNGSRDVQWAELKGLVTGVHSNTISLYLPEGRLDVELEGSFEGDLEPFVKANVRIRGVLYAVWNAATREVRVGRVMMRNSTVSVDVPAPTDPFDAVVRTPRELLLFDAQASAFRPVKVRGQIVYADRSQLYLAADGTGLRLLPVERTNVRPGDLVETVGYPDIGRTELLLREVLVRKTGEAPLLAPRNLEASTLSQETVNSTRVRVEGNLLGWHAEEEFPVLEMQSGVRLYVARIASDKSSALSLRPGSRLALAGVFVGSGRNQPTNEDNKSFELLVNSPADITVLSQPPWWTLPRLFIVVGMLLVILTFTVIWNRQLRRLVEQRTGQLQHEIHERERIERQHALEAERSRIARDLHDDLGSSLTEISVLASSGQLRQTNADHQPSLFQAIGAKARGLISALDVIVWAVDPEDNSLQSLADYLSGYTDDFFSHTNIDCRFKVPVSFPPVTLEGRLRHELLMAVKEGLNNIVRHSEATEVEFRMTLADGCLEIAIADNGKGIEDETGSEGRGLKNLSARLGKMGGNCTVKSRLGGGTIVKFDLPLAENGYAILD
jgi:signal transduction histidine kinase